VGVVREGECELNDRKTEVFRKSCKKGEFKRGVESYFSGAKYGWLLFGAEEVIIRQYLSLETKRHDEPWRFALTISSTSCAVSPVERSGRVEHFAGRDSLDELNGDGQWSTRNTYLVSSALPDS
jgi:hypothetical protein